MCMPGFVTVESFGICLSTLAVLATLCKSNHGRVKSFHCQLPTHTLGSSLSLGAAFLPLGSQIPGCWHPAHSLFVGDWDPVFSECVAKEQRTCLAWSGNDLGLKMVLRALVTCCWCSDSSLDPLDESCLFFSSFFPPRCPGRYNSSTHSSLSKLFLQRRLLILLCTDLDMHPPQIKASWWRKWKERGANAVLLPWGLFALCNCCKHLQGLLPLKNFMQGARQVKRNSRGLTYTCNSLGKCHTAGATEKFRTSSNSSTQFFCPEAPLLGLLAKLLAEWWRQQMLSHTH